MRIGKILNFKIISIVLLFVFGVNIKANADDIVFTANAPQTVEVGEQFRVNFTINAKDCESFEVNILDFQILSGPNVSANSTIQWVNGQMLQKPTKTFTFVLTAENEGKCSIPSATIKCSGKTYQSEPLDIKVVASSNSANSNNNQQPNVKNLPTITPNSNEYDDLKKMIEDDANNLINNSSNHKKSAFISAPSVYDNIDTRATYFESSKYDNKINWNTSRQYGSDINDLRAEAQGHWGRFKDAIIGDKIYSGKEYESKTTFEKLFTGIFWAILLQKARFILLILIVVAIVIFVRRRR